MSPTPTGRLFGDDVVLTGTLRAPIADVWASLTDQERTARWFGPWQGDAAPGRTIRVQMATKGRQPERVGDRRCGAAAVCGGPLARAVPTATGTGRLTAIPQKSRTLHVKPRHTEDMVVVPHGRRPLVVFILERRGTRPPVHVVPRGELGLKLVVERANAALLNNKVGWRPAIDVNKVILGGQIVAVAAFLVIRALIKTRNTRNCSA